MGNLFSPAIYTNVIDAWLMTRGKGFTFFKRMKLSVIGTRNNNCVPAGITVLQIYKGLRETGISKISWGAAAGDRLRMEYVA
jgi:hypothetical protein